MFRDVGNLLKTLFGIPYIGEMAGLALVPVFAIGLMMVFESARQIHEMHDDHRRAEEFNQAENALHRSEHFGGDLAAPRIDSVPAAPQIAHKAK